MRQYEELIRVGPGDGQRIGQIQRINNTPIERLERFIASVFRGFTQNHPCIGARSVFVNGNFFFAVIPDMASVRSALSTVRIVEEYLSIADGINDPIKTLAIVFIGNAANAEDFADKYWSFAQLVHDVDALTNDWDRTVSHNPLDPDFEFSIAKRAIFTTTLNPGHPRVARKFAYPVWVCNQIQQFNTLREKGLFNQWQKLIREADAKLDPSGAHNPILTDHGTASAANQLAGWPVEYCPLSVRLSRADKTEAASLLLKKLKDEPANTEYVSALHRRACDLLDVNPS